MGKYVYARAVGERDLNNWLDNGWEYVTDWLDNGWEYVTEERPNVYLIKRWLSDLDSEPGGNGSKKKRKRR